GKAPAMTRLHAGCASFSSIAVGNMVRRGFVDSGQGAKISAATPPAASTAHSPHYRRGALDLTDRRGQSDLHASPEVGAGFRDPLSCRGTRPAARSPLR